MLCRCYRPPSAPVIAWTSAELMPALRACPPSREFMNTLSAPAARTVLNFHRASRWSLLVEFNALAFASRFRLLGALGVRMAGAQGRRGIEEATPVLSALSTVQHTRLCSSRKPAVPPTTPFYHSTVRRAEPNPSFKPSPNGGSRWPSSAGPAAHFALAAQHAPPSVPA